MFVLVVLLLHGHVLGSIRVHPLWVRPCFSSSVLVRLTWIVFVIGGRWPYSWCLILRQHLFINTNFVVYNRYFLSTYFLVDPFILPYWFYSIRRGIDWYIFHNCLYPEYFLPDLGHHQGRMYYKCDITFVCT